MPGHLLALIQTFLLFFWMAIAYYGWGNASRYVFRIAKPTRDAPFLTIWLGWAFSLLILQAAHLYYPVKANLSILVLLTGVILAVLGMIGRVRQKSWNSLLWASKVWSLLFAGLVLVVAAWVASRAMLPATNYDSGLYHFNTIRWINTYPLVLGLGNLHGRLAFNQSFFTYVAALNLFPYFGHGRSIANSFLFVLTFATLVYDLLPVLQRHDRVSGSHPFLYLPGLFALPFLGYLGLVTINLSSPSPDFPSLLLQLVMFILLARLVAAPRAGEQPLAYEVFCLAVLAATAITIKLSNLAFSATLIGFCLFVTWLRSKNRIKDILKILLPCMIILLVWCIRGVLLSGAPFYPSTIGYLPVGWAVPVDEIHKMANWTFSWARQHNTDYKIVLASWNWVGPWFRGLLNQIVDFTYPAAVTLVFGIACAGVGLVKKESRFSPWHVVILVPPVVGIAYWFFTAPAVRFAVMIFWLLSLSTALLLLLSLQPLLTRRRYLAMVGITFLVVNFIFFGHALTHPRLFTAISLTGWQADEKVPIVRTQLASGLTILTPRGGEQCWDAPLPCAPVNELGVNVQARLRIPGRLRSGFYVPKDDQ